MTQIRDVLDALEGRGCNPVEAGPEQWKSKCPAHDDQAPSLSVRVVDGKIRIKCFAGCEDTTVFDALSLEYPWKAQGKGGEPGDKKGSSKKTPRPLPTGQHLTIYYYEDRKRQPLGAVVRTDKPGEKKDIRQYRYVKDDLYISEAIKAPRPLYQLHLVDTKPGSVVIVEGEKCAQAAAKAWEDRAVVTWPGGTEAWKHVDWNPLRGRDVVLVSDADTPGRKCMEGIAALLASMNCKVEVCLAPGESKDDIVEWLAAGTAVATIKRLKATFEPDPVEPTPDAIRANPHYRILGLIGDQVAIRLSVGRILTITRSRLCSPAELVSLAPERFWYALRGIESLSTIIARGIGDGLIREADRMGQLDVGNVLGRGAARLPNGKTAWHLGDRILQDGKDRGLEDVEGIWQAEPAIPVPKPATDAQVAAARDAILRYRWQTRQDGQRFLGWMAAAVAGGALDWRPHIILAAKASSGKSWLITQVLAPLLGPLLQNYDNVTPAALATDIAGAALPVIIDEAQPSGSNAQRLEQILELFRSASGGGIRAKSDGKGGVTRQSLRFSGMLSATVSPNFGAPDSSRISQVRLGPPVDDWLAVSKAIRSALEAADGIRARMIIDSGKIADNAREIAEEIQSEGSKDTRQSMVTAALTAGYWFWTNQEPDDMVGEFNNEPDVDDALDALMIILGIAIKRPGAPDTTLSYVLRKIEDTGTIAETYGIKYETGTLKINPTSKGLQAALARTAIGGSDLRQLLLQIDGTEYTKHPQRFGTYRYRAVSIPGHVLTANGIDLNYDDKKDDT